MYTPAAAYVITGFCDAEAAGVPPGKVHDHEVGVFVLASKNETDCPAQIFVGLPVKFETGAQLFTVI